MYLPGSLYSIIFLLYSWGSLFGVSSRVPLKEASGEAPPIFVTSKILPKIPLDNPYNTPMYNFVFNPLEAV